MKYRSVRGSGPAVSFRDALFQGLAPDGGLYVPERLPILPASFLDRLEEQSLHEIGLTMLSPYLEEISEPALDEIIRDAWNFPIPLIPLEDRIYLLELFHGATLAFKDVGARFMARILSHFLAKAAQKVTILVATSGDTGSAVSQGFYQVPHVTVFVLYPAGRISKLQEKQITTLGNNVRAVEVQGTFDDCQRLVKQSLADPEVRAARTVTTANSINLGRLLPQIAYYGWALAQWKQGGATDAAGLRVVVPSGNFGNLTAAAYARAMGIPIAGLAAATNANDVVPDYLWSGTYRPRPAVETLSSAMDVGDPSNLARLEACFGHDIESLRREVPAFSVSDSETLEEMRRTYDASGRVLDPHTAVGVFVARKLLAGKGSSEPVLVPATAHPAKFPEVVERAIGVQVPLPPALEEALHRPQQSIPLKNDYEALKEILLA